MRLHLRYREDDLDPRLVELTKRFLSHRAELRKGDDTVKGRLFDTWLHGACLIYEVPFPSFEYQPIGKHYPKDQPTYGEYVAADMKIILKRWSAISLFHQFRHHMQAFAEADQGMQPGEILDDEAHAQDAQAWACSLMYVVAPRRFRRWVRRGRVVGVTERDLLKTRR